MLKQFLSIALIALFISVISAQPVLAQTGAGENQKIEEIKAKVRELGVGREARVELTLNNGRKVKGHIGEIADEHFVLVDRKSGTLISIRYSEVTKLKAATD